LHRSDIQQDASRPEPPDSVLQQPIKEEPGNRAFGSLPKKANSGRREEQQYTHGLHGAYGHKKRARIPDKQLGIPDASIN